MSKTHYVVLALTCAYLPILSAKSTPRSQYKEHLITNDATVSTNLRSLLDDTLVIDVPGPHFKADISYLAMDLKLDRDRAMMKVCEFGQAKNASPLIDCPIVINGNREKACVPFCNLFWHYLSQFDIPIWYIGRDPIKDPKKGASKELFFHRTGWHSLLVVKGNSADTLSDLTKNPLFKKHNRKKTHINHDDISSYKGIIFYNYRDDRFKDKYEKIEQFKKAHPGFLVLDDIVRPYAANKRLGCSLFNTPDTAPYKPRWKKYPKKYTKKLAKKIFKDLACDVAVIKPENSGRSNGIFMAGPDRLNGILKKILNYNKPKRALNYRPVEPETYNYWKKEENSHFLAEAYCPSRPLLLNGKWYEPTMRAFAMLRYDKGKIYVNIFQGFWKVPAYALSEDSTFVNTHCTRQAMTEKERNFRGIAIEHDDVLFMRSCLKDMLPKIYLKMLQRGKQSFFKVPFD